ncbi:hypothetical protein [Actinokineospora sp.]|uniref:hypothetical protein n=1 Tax=Actinokineospora sp. TaxID=1872133 RepID=UPI00403786D6
MRPVPALAAACAAVLPVWLLAGCSNRPNDLYTYYDEAAPTTTAAALAPVPPPRAPVTTTTTTTSAAPAPGQAALTAADLAAEEVVAEGAPERTPPAALADCATAGQRTTWRYPSGSVLRQYVGFHAAGAAPVVAALRDNLGCGAGQRAGGAQRVEPGAALPALPGVDVQTSWCAAGPGAATCTVVLARAGLLTVVTVEAATAARARAAVVRVAPQAAVALARV